MSLSYQTNARGFLVLLMLIVAGVVAVAFVPSLIDFDRRLPARCADEYCSDMIGEVELDENCKQVSFASAAYLEHGSIGNPDPRVEVSAVCAPVQGAFAPLLNKRFVTLNPTAGPVHLSTLVRVELRKKGEVLRILAVEKR